MKLEGSSLKGDFIKFIIPSIIAQWVFALYSMVDGIFVARGVSEAALTAVNISMPFTMALFSISILFAVGTSTIAAIFLGQKKVPKAGEIFTQNIIILIILSIIISILVWIFLDPIAKFLGATETNLTYVTEYIGTLGPFAFAFILSYSFETLIKTDGYPKLATLIVASGAVMNCILDYLFIMVLDMGVFGAAFATGLSQAIVIIFYVLHFLSTKSTIKFTRFKWDVLLIWRQIRLGTSSGITEISAGVTILLFNLTILQYLNENALVSYTIISYVNSIVIMSMVGIAQGFQPLVSYYYGQNRMERCRKLLHYGITAGAAASIAAVLICYFGAGAIVSLFLTDKSSGLYSYSITVFRIFSTSFVIAGFNVIISGYFTGIELPIPATLISLARGFVFILLSLWGLTAIMGGSGVWWAPVLSESLCLILTLVMLHRQGRLHGIKD